MSANERISVEITDGVADVRLIRVDKMNALDPHMFAALVETGNRLKADKSLRAIVLSGEGRAFCAGLDTSNFARMREGGEGPRVSSAGGSLEERTHGICNNAQYAVWVWREMPVPVIAAVHGVAFGGGFQVALGADMRYMAPGTKLSVMEAKWGLVPDMAGMAIMRRLAREDVVRELTYTARIFTAEEALAFGFATRVCNDPRAEALATAREIARKNPDAIRAAKRIINNYSDADAGAILQAESSEQVKIMGTPNQVEAVTAEMEKRAPRFAA
ncbi:crotonase/enoyl-CoA hydratase family protein [Zavarzinia sp. CC-PAN008]|uniref:crotonase/enoyl-CoA hydratase family protein n=1 Tax=Zavarzinia sp. CC-PAN008 TaxID=3243332 RepID=UPI003F744E55